MHQLSLLCCPVPHVHQQLKNESITPQVAHRQGACGECRAVLRQSAAVGNELQVRLLREWGLMHKCSALCSSPSSLSTPPNKVKQTTNCSQANCMS